MLAPESHGLTALGAACFTLPLALRFHSAAVPLPVSYPLILAFDEFLHMRMILNLWSRCVLVSHVLNSALPVHTQRTSCLKRYHLVFSCPNTMVILVKDSISVLEHSTLATGMAIALVVPAEYVLHLCSTATASDEHAADGLPKHIGQEYCPDCQSYLDKRGHTRRGDCLAWCALHGEPLES